MNLKRFSGWFQSVLFLLLVIIGVKLVSTLEIFSNTIFPYIGKFLSSILFSISSLFSFSIGDIFYTFLIFSVLLFVIFLIRCIVKKEWKIVGQSIKFFLYLVSCFYIYFHLIWGYNYYKTPIKDSYNIELDSLDELKSLADMYYKKAVKYRELVHEDDRGVFKMTVNSSEIDQELKNSVLKIQKNYPEINFTHAIQPNLKNSLYSELFSHLGVSGYYNPFTSESQVNRRMPDSKLLFTTFHESAHQFGFAPESEANFVGFLMGIESDHPDFQYVSNFKAMRSILNRILWVDPMYVKGYIDFRYSPGMKRDREYEMEINEKYTGKTGDAFSLMNEAFLKMNNQEGLESYGRFVELLVGFNRK